MFCIEWIWRTTSGTRQIRTRIVSATIDQPHGSPTLLWKKSRRFRRRFSSGASGLATITPAPPKSSKEFLGLSCVVDSAAAPGVTAEQATAGLRAADDETVLAHVVDRVLRTARVVLALSFREEHADGVPPDVDEADAHVPHAAALCRTSPTRSASQSNPRCSAASARPGRTTRT